MEREREGAVADSKRDTVEAVVVAIVTRVVGLELLVEWLDYSVTGAEAIVRVK